MVTKALMLFSRVKNFLRG